jgi:hypothetical protein
VIGHVAGEPFGILDTLACAIVAGLVAEYVADLSVGLVAEHEAGNLGRSFVGVDPDGLDRVVQRWEVLAAEVVLDRAEDVVVVSSSRAKPSAVRRAHQNNPNQLRDSTIVQVAFLVAVTV